MTLNELQRRLIEAARKNPPSGAAPPGFERRVMARLAAMPRADLWAALARPFWIAAGSCATVALACGLWTSAGLGRGEPESFSRQFEIAVYSSVDETALLASATPPAEDDW